MSRQCPFHECEIPEATQECPVCALRDERDEANSTLASATDLLNSWAREMQVPEAYNESDIKGVIERLWSNVSQLLFGEAAALRARAAGTEGLREAAEIVKTMGQAGYSWGDLYDAIMRRAALAAPVEREVGSELRT